MKTFTVIIISSLLFSSSINAQPIVPEKSDSITTKEVIPNQDLFHKPFKFQNPTADRNYKKYIPDFNQLNKNPDFALSQRFGMPPSYRRFDRMPVFRPRFQSKMPVYKPDKNIDFKLRIKRIGVSNP